MELSIIIVNWNVKPLLRDCLNSVSKAIAAAPDLSTEIIVVDSASSDGSPDMVRKEFSWVRLIANNKNVGYAGGNNMGVDAAQGRFLFLLNPDTVVHANILHQLVDFMDSHPQSGAVGPQLLWPDGSIQSSRRRFPTVGTLFWESTLLGQWFPNNRYIRDYQYADQTPDHPQIVEWVVGAAILIRRDAWQQVGPIDEDYFMYFEETDWCRRAVEIGWLVYYQPDAQVVHFEGKSSEQVIAARTIRFQRSKLRYAEKYFGSSWAVLLRVFLWTTFAIQWLEETAKWLLGHKRSLRKQRMIAYGQVLREL
jgi:GT2 family glycosyltransferase